MATEVLPLPAAARTVALPRPPALRSAALKAALAAATLLLALQAARFPGRALDCIRYPYPLDYGEGPLLAQARLLARGTLPYRDVREHLTVANYPPLYPALVAAAMRLGAGTGFAAGRAVSALATLASGVLVFLVVRALGARRPAAFLAALFWLAQRWVYLWGALHRVDALALALTLLGLLLVIRAHGRGGALLAAPVFLLALFTRQTLIAAPLAAAMALLVRDRRRGVAFPAQWDPKLGIHVT